MNLSVAARQLDMTDAIKTHIEHSVDSLKKFNLDIISTRVVVAADERNGKKGFGVEFLVNLKDKGTVVITQVDKDVYAAIDLAIERTKKSLRRYSDKIKDHKVMSFSDLGLEAQAVTEYSEPENKEIEIIPMDLELHKPMSFDEAIEALKEEKKRQFIVFNDNDGFMRVMYKRADGNFGLY